MRKLSSSLLKILPLDRTSFSGFKIDILGLDSIYLEKLELEEDIIFAVVNLQRSIVVIGYYLVITVTFCSFSLLIFHGFSKHLNLSYRWRADNSDDLPYHDHNRVLWIPAKEWDRCSPNPDCVRLYPTTIHYAWGSWRIWCVDSLPLQGTGRRLKCQLHQVISLVRPASSMGPTADLPLSDADVVGLLPCLILLSISICARHSSHRDIKSSYDRLWQWLVSTHSQTHTILHVKPSLGTN